MFEAFNSITIQCLCNSSVCYPFYTTLSPGVYRFELWGSQGQSGPHNDNSEVGGYGGFTWGEINLRDETTIFIFIGNQYGYNGGGAGGLNSLSENGGSGGGSTDIRLLNGDSSDISSLSSRIIVAGGGGGFGGGGMNHYQGRRGHNGGHGNPQVTEYTIPVVDGHAGKGGLGRNGSSNGMSGFKHDETTFSSFELGYDGGNGTFGIGGYGGSVYGLSHDENGPGSGGGGNGTFGIGGYGGSVYGLSHDENGPGSGGGGGGGYYGGGGGGGGSGYWGGHGGSGGGGSGYISSCFYKGEILNGNVIQHTGNGLFRLTHISYSTCIYTLPVTYELMKLSPIIILSLSILIFQFETLVN